MPLVRISIPQGTPPSVRKAIGECVHDAMVEAINVPPADRFQIITEHTPDALVVDPNYLDIARSPAAIIVQITLRSGRTPMAKRALYRAVVRLLHERIGHRPEDVMICLVENELIDWSFGHGEAQLVKE